MSDERLVEIEMKLAHQDQALIELNDVLTKQQETIMTLERLFASMVERLADLDDAGSKAEARDERPPHY